MKINVAVKTANDCIRHVLKETHSEMAYVYAKESRKQALRDRIEHLESVMETLDGMGVFIENQGIRAISGDK